MSRQIREPQAMLLRKLFKSVARRSGTFSTSAECDHYDDPLGLEAPPKVTATVTPPTIPVPTGLTDEEDAARYMALRFNPNARVCLNCEGIYDQLLPSGDQIDHCPRCDDWLQPVGTPPRRRKFNP